MTKSDQELLASINATLDAYKAIARNNPELLEEEEPEREPNIDGGDNCIRCGGPIDHNDPHMYCSNCA